MEFDWAEFPAHDFHLARRWTRVFYSTLAPVAVPSLGGLVVIFNSHGYRHLLYKLGREKPVIIRRLWLLRFVSIILTDSSATATSREDVTEYGTRIEYWAVVATHEGMRLRVIVRRQGGGVWHFYSIMED